MTDNRNKNNYKNLDDSADQEYDLATEKKLIAEEKEEIKKDLLEKYKQRYINAPILPSKVSNINAGLLNFLLSFQNTLFYNDLQKQFGLDDNQRNMLPDIVWTICINNAWNSLNNLLCKNLNIDPVAISQIAEAISKNISTKAQQLSRKINSAREKESRILEDKNIHFPITEAIKQYPEIIDQIITSNQITIRDYKDPVRPSIENWLSDYTARLGYTSHDSIERGNYLFQNENARNLSYADRQRLSQILKSFDEKTPLTINTDTKQIVFSEPAPERKTEAQKIPNSKFQIPNQTQNQNVQITPISHTRENYQPKTQEPGNDFEKVIGLPEKEEGDLAFNAPRIVNLKKQEKELPVASAAPKPKNLLNIKELIAQSKGERLQSKNPVSLENQETTKSQLHIQNYPSLKEEIIKTAPKPVFSEFKNNPVNHIQDQDIRQQKDRQILPSENNSVYQNFSKTEDFDTKKFQESLDETEKKLFQTNNRLAMEGKPAVSPSVPFSKKETPQSNIQFSSPQKLPHEKEKEEIEKKKIETIPPKPQAQPYRILPSTTE